MPDVPTFFFSHTRQDREMRGNYLDRFFDDLEARLAQYAAVDRKTKRIGTIDREVLQGTDWDKALSVHLSTDRCFVAILTPLYFKRENCGKELFAFVLRSRNLGINSNGALTDVENVLPIRWLPEEVYYANTQKNLLIPPLLRLINDTPADDRSDPERTQAIQRYCKKGMERCVSVEPHYEELLQLFVLRIRDMAELPAASGISFATVLDAFTYDWRHHFATAGTTVVVAPPPAEQVAPRALASVVAFYVTKRTFTPDPKPVGFADQLIAEPLPGGPAAADPVFDALLADVRAAGVAERLTVFHAAANPVVPTSPDPLLAHLASLSESRVLTALVVEPTVWPGTAADAEADAVEQIIRSSKWTGLVLLPSLDTAAINVDKLVTERGLPRRIVALPQVSEERITELRRAFVDARGRVLRETTAQASDAERLPVLKGVGAEGR